MGLTQAGILRLQVPCTCILVDFFASTVASTAHFRPVRIKEKSTDNRWIISAFPVVGVTGFEPATTRPPDVYSNRTELRPDYPKPFGLGLQI